MSSKNLRLLVSFAGSDRLSGTLKKIVGLGQSGSEKLATMKKEARSLDRELKDVRGELQRSTGNVTALMNRERDLAAQIAKTNDRMERQVKLLKVAAQADAVKQRGEDLRNSGTGNIIAGVAMAAPGVLAAKQAMTFESAMADVRKVVNFETPQQFRQMGEDITDMSTRIPMSAEGLAQIVAAAGRAGVARKELLLFAQDAAQMGIAFDSTAEDAGAMMAKWRTAFGMGQDEVRSLADKINALTNTYGGNVGAVAGITTRIGALGKVAGLAAPEIAAMGQLMNAVGVEEEIAATGIKNMMLAMTKGAAATKTQQKAFAALQLDASSVADAMQKDAAGAITDLLQRIRKLPKAQQASMLTQLFGSESVAAIAPLLASFDKLQANFALVGDKTKYAGSMQREYLSRIATTEGAVGLATNALKGINITLGTLLLPTITAASQKVVVIANAVRGWAKEHPALAKGLLTAVTSIAGLLIGLGALKFAFGALLGPVSLVMRALPVLLPLLSGIRVAVMLLARGVMQAGLMMLANPLVAAIVGIVAAVGLAGYMVYKHWDKISSAFKNGIAEVKSFFSGLPDWMKSIGSMMMQGLLMALNPALLGQRLLSIAKSGIATFKNFFGIKSPSRLMMGMGGFITDGLARGIDRGSGKAARAAGIMAAGVAAAGTPVMAAPPPPIPVTWQNGIAGVDDVRREEREVSGRQPLPVAPLAKALVLASERVGIRTQGNANRPGNVSVAAPAVTVRNSILRQAEPGMVPATPQDGKRDGAQKAPLRAILSGQQFAKLQAPEIRTVKPQITVRASLASEQLAKLRSPVGRVTEPKAPLRAVLAAQQLAKLQPQADSALSEKRQLKLPRIERLAPPAPDRSSTRRDSQASVRFGDVHISIKAAPGQNAQEIAEAIDQKLREHADKAAAAKRSSFHDDED